MTIQPTRIASVDFAKGVNNALQQFDLAREQKQRNALLEARKEAGRLASQGDTQGARNALLQSGDFTAAERLAQLFRVDERKTARDVNGMLRFLTSGEQVFPGVSKQHKAPTGFTLNDPTNPAAGMTPIPGFLEAKEQLKRAGASNTTVNIANSTGKKFGERFGSKLADKLDLAHTAAQDAVSDEGIINEAESLLKSGIFSGRFADLQLQLNSALQDVGLTSPDPRVSNTQAYMAALGGRVANIIKQFGAGTGLSDADRQFAERMAGGQIQLSEPALRRILSLGRRANKVAIGRFEKMRGRLFNAKDSDGAPLIPAELQSIYDLERPTQASAPQQQPSGSGLSGTTKSGIRFTVE